MLTLHLLNAQLQPTRTLPITRMQLREGLHGELSGSVTVPLHACTGDAPAPVTALWQPVRVLYRASTSPQAEELCTGFLTQVVASSEGLTLSLIGLPGYLQRCVVPVGAVGEQPLRERLQQLWTQITQMLPTVLRLQSDIEALSTSTVYPGMSLWDVIIPWLQVGAVLRMHLPDISLWQTPPLLQCPGLRFSGMSAGGDTLTFPITRQSDALLAANYAVVQGDSSLYRTAGLSPLLLPLGAFWRITGTGQLPQQAEALLTPRLEPTRSTTVTLHPHQLPQHYPVGAVTSFSLRTGWEGLTAEERVTITERTLTLRETGLTTTLTLVPQGTVPLLEASLEARLRVVEGSS
ncbi:hypothetical protein H6771_02765 [Candidatus Peribacteria bacterium]|nr:hypothetical protein [Candidatus Peribacteria bacterium]